MTAETPGTPLTPEEEAELRRLVNFSSMPHDAGCPVKRDPENGVCLCGQNTAAIQLARRATGTLIARILATLDLERRERVDPDPLHPDDGHEHSWGCRRCGVDPSPRQMGERVDPDLRGRYFETFDAADGHKGIRLAATPDHTEGGEEPTHE